MDLTAYDILQRLENGQITSEQLVSKCLARINETNDNLRAVHQISSKALQDAKIRDRERSSGRPLGSLHGVPILIKATFATEPYFDMDTTSGNFALAGSRPRMNAVAVQKLLDEGAVIIGTGTLSELSYWKISQIPAGWSPAGGQGQNPYVKGGRQSSEPPLSINGPGGSSSGPSIAVAAGYVPVALGEETSGSLVFPADRAALYTVKTTVGSVSQAGMVPASHRFDVAGPLAKSSRDIALFLDVLVDHKPPGGYMSCVKGVSGWRDLRVGVLDPAPWLYDDELVGWKNSSKTQIIQAVSAAYDSIEAKVDTLKSVAFESYPNCSTFNNAILPLMVKMFEYDWRRGFDAYLTGLDHCKISSLADLLTPDDKYAALQTPNGQHGHEILERAVNPSVSEEESRAAEVEMREASRAQGIDKILKQYEVDVILGPGNGPLYNVAAAAGYPIASLPLSTLDDNGCPFGLVALTTAYREDLLVTLQSAWEETFPARKSPPGFK